jgi:hypothetical protein
LPASLGKQKTPGFPPQEAGRLTVASFFPSIHPIDNRLSTFDHLSTGSFKLMRSSGVLIVSFGNEIGRFRRLD